ncbi:hypothetical protein PN498_21640 [Oscillatoria sp. CS-180]|uniref:hypothetical protein n=1 Tax=Oscillatoria sp. CS-180 TaxID=3021720 RepID=UPI0023300DAE|nr:hypothetical protein [Oscillatoria sp. CS-180]MDB9528609.1 hypothetical protein [Oscillatoria sp. CS-180]
MSKFLVCSVSALAAIAATVAIASTAQADEPPIARSAYVPDAVNDIFFSNTGSYAINRTVGGQLGTMFGVLGFPEQAVVDDAYAVFDVYNYLMEQQTRSDDTIRVPDLINPYDTSILFLPETSPIGAISGSEFIFE